MTLERRDPAKKTRGKRFTITITVLVLIVAGAALGTGLYLSREVGPRPPIPNPCGQVYERPSLPGSVMCHGFVLTETGAVCSLSAGSCTMTVTNNETSRFEVVTTGCSMMLPIMVNGTGANGTTTLMPVEAVNGGLAESGVPPGSTSGATCWFPTNKYMADVTVDGHVSGCFTFAQAGNLANWVSLCWYSGKWSTSPSTNAPLDCPDLLSNLGVTFDSLNVSVGYATVRNANSYGVWVAGVNGTATVGPLGISVRGPFAGDWFAIPQNETVLANSTVVLNLPGSPNQGKQASYTLSFLPTNETISYTQPCSETYRGTYPTTSG
ncbi:MAG TPA: hypothetical protein VEC02_06025 [Nitrososphaerales archaeon]|nr:hypothetical protein [Nitrososphaerales archaeon]